MDEEQRKALSRALRFISYRPRSSGEVVTRLRRFGYDSDIIDPVLEQLTESRLLDDGEFARAYFDEMLGKGFGWIRIERELQKKLLSRELIENVMSNYPAEREVERCLDSARSFEKRILDMEPSRKYVKLKRHLVGKGYGWEVADSVARSLCQVDT